MSRGAREKCESGTYHIMIRGANKQEIFHDTEDRLRFLETLKRYKREFFMNVYGWCLMGNHVHLLLGEGSEVFSETLKRIGISYVWYYHQKYQTTGHLFQDRFKSENVDSEGYLKTVIRYIHQNPVKAGLVKRVDQWPWSSCLGYYGKHVEPGGMLDKAYILGMFGDRHAAVQRFKEFTQADNEDMCLDIEPAKRLRLSDDEARQKITELLEGINIAQVKSLPKPARDEVLRKVKKLEGISQRQAARILGVSVSQVFRA